MRANRFVPCRLALLPAAALIAPAANWDEPQADTFGQVGHAAASATSARRSGLISVPTTINDE